MVVGLMLVGLLSGCAGTSAGTDPTLPAPAGLTPRGPSVSHAAVSRVVDGDTLHVLVDGQDVTVRMIGIDTPETVKPDAPVECYGPEASDFAKQALTGKAVTLEFDGSQGRTDRFGRTLAYVWVEEADGGLRMFNYAAVAAGYAEERQYGSVPPTWGPELSAAEESARIAMAGRWGACG